MSKIKRPREEISERAFLVVISLTLKPLGVALLLSPVQVALLHQPVCSFFS